MKPLQSSQKKIIIVGGGPSGFLAAGTAAKNGAEVLILEKMKRCGRKLNITGKGRCNLTNTAPKTEFLTHFGENGPFLEQAFSHFFSQNLVELLNTQGLTTKTERGGRIFPENDRAPDVTKALERWLDTSGVTRTVSQHVEQVLVEHGRVIGVRTQTGIFDCDAVIIATGGASYPKTGSSGDGYKIAKTLGHSIVPFRPALVPLETVQNVRDLNGLNLKNVRVYLEVDQVEARVAFGEMTFTETGVSGPIILSLSGEIVDSIDAGKRVKLRIDLKPALNSSKLTKRLERDFQKRAHEPIKSVLRGLIPRELVPVCLRSLKWNPNRRLSSFNKNHLIDLKNWLKHFELDISGYRPFSEAIVTAGGIELSEVHAHSMESKIVKNLYFAGEVLDLQADTGGYNLQGSFSTGYLAGKSAAEGEHSG